MKKIDPSIIVRKGRSGPAEYAHEVEIMDSNNQVVARVTSLEPPLSCGASIYIICEYEPVPIRADLDDLSLNSACGILSEVN
jgi:hypothetical protein